MTVGVLGAVIDVQRSLALSSVAVVFISAGLLVREAGSPRPG